MNSNAYLVALMFGPVQGFISAARRTRDLWFGSWLLSEISKAAAKGLRDYGNSPAKAAKVTLIFPCAADADLEKESGLSVANKIVALIETDHPQACVEAAKCAAISRWRCLAERCAAEFGKNNINLDVWSRQVPAGTPVPPDDLVECYGAWAPLGNDYAASMKRVNELLNARKATRDFPVAAAESKDAPGYGIWKSSLDGARESVLDVSASTFRRQRFGIDRNEELDAPGLVKRVLGQDKSFTALARVACDPWVRLLRDKHPLQLRDLKALYEKLKDANVGLVTGARAYSEFKYDAQLVYDFRVQQAIADWSADKFDLEITESKAKEVKEILKNINVLLHFLHQATPTGLNLPKPDSYVAVLVADGDHMGRLISTATQPAQHQKISRVLAGFAKRAPQIVQAHHGECVYTGGDDVLAFVPAAHALACANELAQTFADMLATVVPGGVPGNERPTLSVGLAFGHILTPLGTLRDMAARAEAIAKHGLAPGDVARNALGIVISPRSGAPLELRGQWNDTVNGAFVQRPGLAKRLAYWTECFANEDISDRAPYQLRTLIRELEIVPDALVSEVERCVARKSENEELLKHIANYLQQRGATAAGTTHAEKVAVAAHALQTEWLAARWLKNHREEIWQ